MTVVIEPNQYLYCWKGHDKICEEVSTLGNKKKQKRTIEMIALLVLARVLENLLEYCGNFLDLHRKPLINIGLKTQKIK